MNYCCQDFNNHQMSSLQDISQPPRGPIRRCHNSPMSGTILSSFTPLVPHSLNQSGNFLCASNSCITQQFTTIIKWQIAAIFPVRPIANGTKRSSNLVQGAMASSAHSFYTYRIWRRRCFAEYGEVPFKRVWRSQRWYLDCAMYRLGYLFPIKFWYSTLHLVGPTHPSVVW